MKKVVLFLMEWPAPSPDLADLLTGWKGLRKVFKQLCSSSGSPAGYITEHL